MPDSRVIGPSRALIVSPDGRMVAELKHLLSRELPRMALVTLEAYPTRSTLAALPDSGGIQLCFLDIASDQGTAFATLALVGNCCPGVPIFALLPSNDPDLILRCLRQGATEFLIQPFTADQFQAAVAKLSRFHGSQAARPENTGRVLCVMPGKGSCGATTVACHLAHALKRQEAGKILLADLDGLTGTVAFLLKLKSTYSFVDAVTHAGSLDADVWRALVTPYHGVDVLLSPENPVDSMAEIADPEPIVSYSRRAYGTVILDASGPYGEWNAALARLCDELLLVATSELAALHAVQRAQLYLEAHGAERDKTRLVINRSSGEVGLGKDGIEAALNTEVYCSLPSDYEAIQKSLMEGKPVAPGSRFGKAICKLAGQLTGAETNGKKSSGITGLFRRLAS